MSSFFVKRKVYTGVKKRKEYPSPPLAQSLPIWNGEGGAKRRMGDKSLDVRKVTPRRRNKRRRGIRLKRFIKKQLTFVNNMVTLL